MLHFTYLLRTFSDLLWQDQYSKMPGVACNRWRNSGWCAGSHNNEKVYIHLWIFTQGAGSLPESSDNSLQPVPEWLPRGETLPQPENRFVIMSTFIMACQHCHYLWNSDPSEAEAQHLFLMEDSSVHLSQNFSFKAHFVLFLVGISTNGTKTQLFACRGKLKIQRIHLVC